MKIPHIKRLRQLAGLTQDEVSSKLMITSSAYSKLENGITDLTIKRAYELASIFNIDICEVIQVSNEESVKALQEIITKKNREIYDLQRKVINLTTDEKGKEFPPINSDELFKKMDTLIELDSTSEAHKNLVKRMRSLLIEFKLD